MLYIIATPIGNLGDITLRSLEKLKEVDGIICEDSRRSSLLLNHYQIKKPLLVINDYNEASHLNSIIEKLKSGQNLALITDAGTPLVSDPGYKIVRECIKEEIEIDSLPGPSAVIDALTLSGLAPDKFFFLGYFPEKPGKRSEVYQKIKDVSKILPTTFIAFAAPFKLNKTLTEMEQFFGDIEITLATELTKIHQSVKSQKISTWLTQFKKQPPRGEWVMLLRFQ